MLTFPSRSLKKLFDIPALATTLARFLLILAGERWNNDIPNAILPGLHCWYCGQADAPYSLLWHIISYPLAIPNSTIVFISGTFIIDYFAMAIARKHIGFIYNGISIWIGLQAPYNLPILWLTLLGLKDYRLSLLGPLSKLPTGSEVVLTIKQFLPEPCFDCPPLPPFTIWNYVLHTGKSASDYQYYLLMIAVFIIVFIHSYRRRKPNAKANLDT